MPHSEKQEALMAELKEIFEMVTNAVAFAAFCASSSSLVQTCLPAADTGRSSGTSEL